MKNKIPLRGFKAVEAMKKMRQDIKDLNGSMVAVMDMQQKMLERSNEHHAAIQHQHANQITMFRALSQMGFDVQVEEKNKKMKC